MALATSSCDTASARHAHERAKRSASSDGFVLMLYATSSATPRPPTQLRASVIAAPCRHARDGKNSSRGVIGDAAAPASRSSPTSSGTLPLARAARPVAPRARSEQRSASGRKRNPWTTERQPCQLSTGRHSPFGPTRSTRQPCARQNACRRCCDARIGSSSGSSGRLARGRGGREWGRGASRRRQRRAVDLARVGQRDRGERDEARGDEEPGRDGDHVLPQLLGRRRQARLEYHIRREALRCRGALRHDDRFGDRRMLEQQRLDLGRLDPAAAHLQLAVDAADVLEHAVVEEAHEIPGPVERRAAPRSGSETNWRSRELRRPRYPLARPAPPTSSSPGTPIGTSCRSRSTTRTSTLSIGRPIGTRQRSSRWSRGSHQVASHTSEVP